MVAVPYGVARVSAEPAAKAGRAQGAVPRKSWFARFMDALIEARMQQARREIRMHTGLLPYTLDERGNRLVKSASGDMPLGGWPRQASHERKPPRRSPGAVLFFRRRTE
jgi:hypothetical protein